MSETQNQHHQTTPAPQQPPVTSQYYSDTFSNIIKNEDCDDQYEQQQLISDLLSSSASTCSSPSETTSFPYQQVKFVSYPYFLPCFESSCSSSYITINGNEETCGSSFSDTDSSVMASFDTTASFHISHAFSISGLLQNDDDFFSGNDVTMLKSRDLGGVDEDEEDGVWDWSVFLRQDPTTPTQ